MSAAINNALSGLADASRRIEVAAQNIASQNATTTRKDGAAQSTPYLPQDIVSISNANGGVRSEQRTAAKPTTELYNPEDPAADEKGLVKAPNVDIATQLVNTKIASYDFKANLKVLQTQHNVEQSLLDIFT